MPKKQTESPDDIVIVRMTGSERVRFHQFVEITRKEWEEIKSGTIENAEELIDKTNIHESDGIEDVTAELVDLNENPVKPPDKVCWDN